MPNPSSPEPPRPELRRREDGVASTHHHLKELLTVIRGRSQVVQSVLQSGRVSTRADLVRDLEAIDAATEALESGIAQLVRQARGS